MFRNHFKTLLRNLWRNKAYSLLNILGLAVGIACTGLIFLWVEDELNYDSFHEKKDRLYAVRNNHNYDAYVLTHWSTPGIMAPVMQQEITGIANSCRTTEDQTRLLFNIGEKAVYASGKFVDSSFFSMFTFPFVQGNAAMAFKQLHSLVITEKAAKKFFGNENQVIGKSIRVDQKQDYIITGVVKDIPGNSSLQFEWVAPFDIYYQKSSWAHEWGNGSVSTYVELKPGVDPTSVNQKLENYIQTKAPRSISHLFLFSINDWRLHDKFENGKQTGGGRIEFVKMFAIIAWIILLIACINFMNLATARCEKRAREVGVRKVLGAKKKALVIQFIGEALFMALLAALGALVVMGMVLPLFNTIIEKTLSLGIDNPLHISALVLITLICGFVAGSYPSLYLSAFNPVFVLKGIRIKTGSAGWIRKGLVVLQFTVSIVLIISTVLIYQQIQYVKNRNLGFDKENLLEVTVQGEMARNFAIIKDHLINTGVVESAALSDHVILYGGNNTDGLNWAGKPAGSKVLVSGRSVTPEFFKLSGMKILEGRTLQDRDSLQSNGLLQNMNVLVTRSLADLMGGGSAVGKTLRNDGDATTQMTVVGVVNDYVYGNMYGKPDPVAFSLLPLQYSRVLYLRFKSGTDTETALAKVEEVIKKDNPGYPMEYRFVDDQFNQMFLSEMLISKLSRVFATLAIIISCLGLFGLAAYTAERRTKEIGIRKVLGASVNGLAGLLTKEFLQLVFVSCIIACPLAWWVMHNWLENYPYRIEIRWEVFVISGITALIIAWLAVSFQTIKTALANPIQSLRTE